MAVPTSRYSYPVITATDSVTVVDPTISARDTEWSVYVQRIDPERKEECVEAHDDE